MSDTGLSNLVRRLVSFSKILLSFKKNFIKDMEMIKFVITCLKVYYPGLIDYMLIFQMPFIFNGKNYLFYYCRVFLIFIYNL
jgi:hypothetical protein